MLRLWSLLATRDASWMEIGTRASVQMQQLYIHKFTLEALGTEKGDALGLSAAVTLPWRETSGGVPLEGHV